MSKWFKRVSDSESDSGSDSSSDSDSSSSTDSSSSSSAAAPGLNAWLRKDAGAGGAADSSARATGGDGDRRVRSRHSREEEECNAVVTQISKNLHNRDWASLVQDLEKLQKKTVVKSTGGFGRDDSKRLERFFLKGLKCIEEKWEDDPPKETAKKLKGTPAAKPFGRFHQAAKKLIAENEEKLKSYKDDDAAGEQEESESEEADFDAEDDEKAEREQKKQKSKEAKAEEREEKKRKEEQEAEEWSESSIDQKLTTLLDIRGRKSTDRSKLVEELKLILSKTQTMPHMTVKLLSALLSCQMDLSNGLKQVMPTPLWKQCYETITRLMNLLQDHPNIVIIDSDDVAEQMEAQEGGKKQAKIDDSKIQVSFQGSFHHTVERLADEFTKSLQQADPHTQDYVTRLRDEGYLLDLTERVFVYYRETSRSVNRQSTAARMALRMLDHLYYRHQSIHVNMIQKQRQLTFERKATKKVKGKKGKKGKGAVVEEDEEGAVVEQPITSEFADPDDEDAKHAKEAAAAAAAASAGDQYLAQFAAKLDQRTKRTNKWVVTEDLRAVMKLLHAHVQKFGTEQRFKTKAMLQYIYHLALHDDYSNARDSLLMSRHNAESPDHQTFVRTSELMILYNRVLAQLGLAAFRAGEMTDANTGLNELCATARTREYLAQTVVRSYSRDRQDEIAEKARLVPFHMHINADLLDGVHLIAAILHEVPIRAQYPHDTKHRPASKALQRLLHSFSHSVFLGPPETTKELIYAAFGALSDGDWREAHRLIMKMNAWTVMRDVEKIQAMVTERLKVCALRTYLFTFSRFYASVRLNELATKYELPEEKVQAVVSRMIIRHDINAAWDQPRGCITVESVNATKLQYLALQLADRCNSLVDYNEQRQAEKEARGERGFVPYHQQKAGGRRYNMGGKWESGAAGAARTANTTFKYNRTQTKDTQRNPFAQRRWGK